MQFHQHVLEYVFGGGGSHEAPDMPINCDPIPGQQGVECGVRTAPLERYSVQSSSARLRIGSVCLTKKRFQVLPHDNSCFHRSMKSNATVSKHADEKIGQNVIRIQRPVQRLCVSDFDAGELHRKC